MRNYILKFFFIPVFLASGSCNEPETMITDIVHTDGSVTRQIEMRNTENKFEIGNIPVPFDSTWMTKDALEIQEDGDTIWLKTAQKVFKNVGELNHDYLNEHGSNRNLKRRAEFTRNFRWFGTRFRFAEVIEKSTSYGYPVSDFLDKDELDWFYMPDDSISHCLLGPDSLKYWPLKDTVDSKIEIWKSHSIVMEWIGTFDSMTRSTSENDSMMSTMKSRKDDLYNLVAAHENDFDSLWNEGLFLCEFIGDTNAVRYRAEADSALSDVIDMYWPGSDDYNLRIIMPGKVKDSNGFSDSTGVLLFPVKSDFFLTEPYIMWAESYAPNTWAWIITGIFGAGILIWYIKKKRNHAKRDPSIL